MIVQVVNGNNVCYGIKNTLVVEVCMLVGFSTLYGEGHELGIPE